MINIDNIFPDSTAEILEKGKAAAIGEIRTWSGKKFQKTANGWIPISNGRSVASEQQEEKQTKTEIPEQQKIEIAPQESEETFRSSSKEESQNSKSEVEKVSKKKNLSEEEKKLQEERREAAHYEIKEYLREHFVKLTGIRISKKPNENGRYVVSCSNSLYCKSIPDEGLRSNDLFDWGTIADFEILDYKTKTLKGCPEKVSGTFRCRSCYNLTSLEGAPKEAKNFYCDSCYKLTSLEGAPKEVDGSFDCYGCRSLKTLKGAPEKVGGTFDCRNCDNLISLEGAPKEVGRNFECAGCKNLKSLEGVSSKIGHNLYCGDCGFEIDQKDILDTISNIDLGGRVTLKWDI